MNISPAMLLSTATGPEGPPATLSAQGSQTPGAQGPQTPGGLFALLLSGALNDPKAVMPLPPEGAEGSPQRLRLAAAWEQALPQPGKSLPVEPSRVRYLQTLGVDRAALLGRDGELDAEALVAELERGGANPGDRPGDSPHPFLTLPALLAASSPSPAMAQTTGASAEPAGGPPPELLQVFPEAARWVSAAAVVRPEVGQLSERASPLTATASSGAGGEGREAAPPAPIAEAARPMPEVASTRGAGPVLQMEQPLGRGGWDAELGSRVLWMTRQEVHSAQLRLNPPNLGPLEVRVSVQQDSANIAFASQHAQVREAIEVAIPRLRDMLADNGYSLVDVNVSDRSMAQQGRDGDALMGGDPDRAETAAQEDPVGAEGDGAVAQTGVGLVDYFA